MPQDEILSGHWDHAFCTSFTAVVHFKDSKDKFLKKKRFIIVSNYMNHDKYAVLKFLDIISDEFSKSHPDLIISKRFLHSDGTAQHFKQKYSLCTMKLMDGNIEWDFSATSHGKRDRWLRRCGTCKQRVCEQTLACTIDPQNSIDFAECAFSVCPAITILHCLKTDVEKIKQHLTIPGTLTIKKYIYHSRYTKSSLF